MTDDDGPDRGLRAKLIHRYPRIGAFVDAFKNKPFSGNALRVLLDRGSVPQVDEQVQSLPAPAMWEQQSSIVLSHYMSYGSQQFPTYWTTVVSQLSDQYSGAIRYEHHDLVPYHTGSTAYKLATLGRVVQHQVGNEAFWQWFDYLMVDGVADVVEGVELADKLFDSIDAEEANQLVQQNAYQPVLWSDSQQAVNRLPEEEQARVEELRSAEQGVFVLYLNGEYVEPSYDAIIGRLNDIVQ